MPNFEDVYRANRSYVFHRCLSMTRSREDADDLTQEVFISVLRNLHRFNGRAKISTWLYRITVNTVLMSRRRKRFRTVPLADIDPPTYANPARDLMVREALAGIPAKDRQVLLLAYAYGETYEEIGAGVDPGGTVKSRCLRARRRFREALA